MKKNLDLISYPFLNEPYGMVDHEVMTDHLSSILGRILSLGTPLYDETFFLMENALHLNGSIRGKLAITDNEIKKGLEIMDKLKALNADRIHGFVMPTGHILASEYHVARGYSKNVCRNLYIMKNSGIDVPEILFDFTNLMTNLLFVFSLEINRQNQIEEIQFISKSYV